MRGLQPAAAVPNVRKVEPGVREQREKRGEVPQFVSAVEELAYRMQLDIESWVHMPEKAQHFRALRLIVVPCKRVLTALAVVLDGKDLALRARRGARGGAVT